jgi:hypothetical protein
MPPAAGPLPGPKQPRGVGELQPAAGAHEEGDAELGFEAGDLFGLASADYCRSDDGRDK